MPALPVAADPVVQPGLTDRLSRYFRNRRDKGLRDLILAERGRVPGVFTILDLGGRVDYWQRLGFDFLETHDITVLCVNYTAAELHANTITHPRIAVSVGDACNMVGVTDDQYHMVHSNSVIEHVGQFSNVRAFAGEVDRLAPAYYVQTPYFWFPIDPHWPKMPFFHWMPNSWRYKLLCRFELGWGNPCRDIDHAMSDLEGTRLLDRRQMNDLFPRGAVRFEWFLGLPKSMIAERRSAVGARGTNAVLSRA